MKTKTTLLFFVLISAQAICLSLFHKNFHEPWRDEVQHLLLSFAHPTLGSLLSALRFEGHPPLLHLLYRTLGLGLEPRQILAVVSGLGYFVLGTSFYALLLASEVAVPLAGAAAGLLSLTYVATYELGVISRGYGLGLGLALWGAAALIEGEKGKSSRAAGFLFLALAAFTSVHSALLAYCLLLPFLLRWAMQGNRRALIFAALTQAVPIGLLVWLLRANPDRMPSFVEASVTGIGMKLFHLVQQIENGHHVWQLLDAINYRFSDFVFPVPWWNFEYSEILRWIGVRIFWMLLIATVGSQLNRRHQRRLTTIVMVTVIFSVLLFDFFFRYLYPSSFRHHLFFYFPLFVFIVVHWMRVAGDTPSPHATPLRLGFQKGCATIGLTTLGLLFCFQMMAGALALGSDYFWYFSQTAMAPAFIPNSPKSIVMVDSDFTGTAIALYLPQAKLYSRIAGGRSFSYVKWDSARSEGRLTRKALFARLCSQVKQDPSLSLYYLTVYPSFDPAYPMREIFASSPSVPTAVLDERFRYYAVSCQPPAAPRAISQHASLTDETAPKAN